MYNYCMGERHCYELGLGKIQNINVITDKDDYLLFPLCYILCYLFSVTHPEVHCRKRGKVIHLTYLGIIFHTYRSNPFFVNAVE